MLLVRSAGSLRCADRLRYIEAYERRKEKHEYSVSVCSMSQDEGLACPS